MARVCLIHPYPSEYLLDALSGQGHEVVLVTALAATKILASANIERVALFDDVAVHKVIESRHTVQPFDIILPIYEGSTCITARIAANLGLPGNSVAATAASRNKYETYRKLREAGIPTPKTVAIPSDGMTWEWLGREVGYPAILKLSDSMNSQGVCMVRSPEDGPTRLSTLQALLCQPLDCDPIDDRNRLAYGRGPVKLIAQEFCDGPEVGVDLLYKNGQWVTTAIFEKAEGMGPFFAESMSISPTSLGATADKDLSRIAFLAVNALGATIGAAHVEIRYGSNGPKVLDVGLRPGGGYTMQATERLTGINIPATVVEMLLGGALPYVTPRDITVLYGGIVYPRSGVLKGISGLEAFNRAGWLEALTILHRPGDRVYALPESAQPHFAYYMIVGNNRDEVLEHNRRIQSEVKLDIDPFV